MMKAIMHNLRRLAIVASLLFVLCTAAHAQQPPLQDALLDHLVGTWVLQGTIAGKPTVQDLTATWVLNHHYVALHEVSREKLPSGQPFYEATVYIGWNPDTSEYGCVWLDTYGGVLPVSLGTAPHRTEELAFVFKDPDPSFHTTFRYLEKDGSWTWAMDNDVKGTLKPFARLTMTQVKPPAK
jgi:hypothetical protein